MSRPQATSKTAASSNVAADESIMWTLRKPGTPISTFVDAFDASKQDHQKCTLGPQSEGTYAIQLLRVLNIKHSLAHLYGYLLWEVQNQIRNDEGLICEDAYIFDLEDAYTSLVRTVCDPKSEHAFAHQTEAEAA